MNIETDMIVITMTKKEAEALVYEINAGKHLDLKHEKEFWNKTIPALVKLQEILFEKVF